MRSVAELPTAVEIDALSEVEVLHGICHAYGSAQTMSEALSGAARWARAAVGSAGTTIRIDIIREDGVLSAALVDAGHDDRMASRTEVDAAIRSKRPRVLDNLKADASAAVAVLPLVSRGEVFGALELAGDRLLMERRWLTVISVASQLAIALRSLRDRERLMETGPAASPPELSIVRSQPEPEDPTPGLAGRVLVVEDRRLFSEGLRTVLKQQGTRRVWTAGTAAEAMTLALAEGPDVVLVDVRLPDGSGIDLGIRILEARPGTVVVALADEHERRLADRAMRAGFRGFLTTDMPLNKLLAAMDAAARGRVVIAPTGPSRTMPDPADVGVGTEGPTEQLTVREREILMLLVQGRSTKEMARRLDLSRHTVRTHIQNILSKLGVHSRLEAAAYALLYGLVELEPPVGEAPAIVS
jgi:two-component system nitrate/nitrite response regulator NarL